MSVRQVQKRTEESFRIAMDIHRVWCISTDVRICQNLCSGRLKEMPGCRNQTIVIRRFDERFYVQGV